MSDEMNVGGEASAEVSTSEPGEVSNEIIEASEGSTEEVSEEVSEEEGSTTGSDEESSENAEVQAETEQELEEEIKEAIEDGASEEEVKDMIRQFTLKVNGKELVKEIDLSDEEALKKELQLSYAGRQAMQDLAELKKMYAGEIRKLMDNPFQVMSEIDPSFDPMELVKTYVEEEYQKSQLTPEQKEAKEREQAFRQLQEENQRLKAEAESSKKQEELEKLELEIEADIVDAIENDTELNLDEDTIVLVAEELIWADENGFNDMKAKDVLPTVKERLKRQFRSATSKFKSTAALKEYMGEDLLNKLREERIQLAKEQKSIKNISNIKNSDVTPSKKEEEVEEKIPLSELFR